MEKTEPKKDIKNIDVSEAKEMCKCENCTYRCKKEITLKKLMNTKHFDKNSDIVNIQLGGGDYSELFPALPY